MSRTEAANYLGISPSTFSVWVNAGHLPLPVFGSKRWDRYALDDALNRLRGIEPGEKITVDPFLKWKAIQDMDPSPPPPTVGLVDRQERALRALGKRYPKHATSAEIDGVGDTTLQDLVQKGSAYCNGKDQRGRLIFILTKAGFDDYSRLLAIDEWRAKRRR